MRDFMVSHIGLLILLWSLSIHTLLGQDNSIQVKFQFHDSETQAKLNEVTLRGNAGPNDLTGFNDLEELTFVKGEAITPPEWKIGYGTVIKLTTVSSPGYQTIRDAVFTIPNTGKDSKIFVLDLPLFKEKKEKVPYVHISGQIVGPPNGPQHLDSVSFDFRNSTFHPDESGFFYFSIPRNTLAKSELNNNSLLVSIKSGSEFFNDTIIPLTISTDTIASNSLGAIQLHRKATIQIQAKVKLKDSRISNFPIFLQYGANLDTVYQSGFTETTVLRPSNGAPIAIGPVSPCYAITTESKPEREVQAGTTIYALSLNLKRIPPWWQRAAIPAGSIAGLTTGLAYYARQQEQEWYQQYTQTLLPEDYDCFIHWRNVKRTTIITGTTLALSTVAFYYLKKNCSRTSK